MQSENGRLPTLRLDEFLEKDFTQLYTIQPLLAVEGIGLLHGKGGHGKTQFAFALANAITSGEDFLGRYPVEQGKVLYLQLDMPEALFQQRWQMAREDISKPEDLYVVPFKPLDILQPSRQRQLQRTVEAIEPQLVIIDTLRKLHYEDENDNAVPMQVYDAVRTAVGPHASTIIIHHDRKSSYIPKGFKKDSAPSDSSSEDDFIESFRGARAWVDDCDLGIHLYKYGSKNKVRMSWSKLRCAPQEGMLLSLNDDTLLIEPKPPETAREWAIQFISEGADLKELTKMVEEASGCSDRVARRVVAEEVSKATRVQ